MPRRLWTGAQPPSGPFVLNRASPQAARLLAWWTVAAQQTLPLRDLAGGLLAAPAGTVTLDLQPELGVVAKTDAATGYLDAGSPAVLGDLPNAGPLSIAAWIRLDTGGAGANRALLAKANDGGQGWDLRVPGGTGAAEFNVVRATATAHVASSTTFNASGAARHLVATYAGIAAGQAPILYDNGTDVSTGAAAGSGAYVSDAAYNLAIGRLGSGSFWYFGGAVFDVRVYTRALSPAEVWQLYDPATRWELYRPQVLRAVVPLPAAPAGGLPFFLQSDLLHGYVQGLSGGFQ